MHVTCRSILSLPYANQLKLVAGRDGIENVISWVYYMEDPHYVDWLKGGELVLITGAVTKESEKMLLSLIDALYEKNAAGVIINLSIYIKAIPASVMERGDFLGLPIFEMPEQMRIVDISQSICFEIFKEKNVEYDVSVILFGILSGSRLTAKRLKRLEEAGYQRRGKYRVLVFQSVAEETVEEQGTDEETTEREFKRLDQVIRSYMQADNCLTTTDEDSYIWMVPVLDNQEIRAFTEDFGSFLQKKGMLTKFRIGVGNVFTDLKQLRNSVESAQEAIRIGVAESSDSVFHIYDDMIMLRLFEKFEDREELIEIAEFTLKELLSKQNEELLLTLRQFIKCGFRAKLAAEQLYIHENTMHYRLKKIASILKVDLKNYHDLFRLTLAVEIVQMYITPLDGKGGNADSNAQK